MAAQIKCTPGDMGCLGRKVYEYLCVCACVCIYMGICVSMCIFDCVYVCLTVGLTGTDK